MITLPQRVLGEALLFSSGKYPSKTAVIIRSREYTYSSLIENALKVASHLVVSGINKGDRVAVYMNN